MTAFSTSGAWGLDDNSFSCLQVLERIGEGMYGEVFKTRHTQTGEHYALKKLRLQDNEEGVPITTLRELGILRHLRHRNVVMTYGVKVQDTRAFIVMEYACTHMSRLLENHSFVKLTVAQCSGIIQQLLSAVAYCQQQKVVHRDIKPANVLFTADGTVKLCDFGLAKYIRNPVSYGNGRLTREVVTLWYRPPEILMGVPSYNASVDVWSVGCIYGELLTGIPLFKGDCEFGQLLNVFRTLGTPTEESWPGFTNTPFFSPMFPRWAGEGLSVPGIAEEKAAQILPVLNGMLSVDPAGRLTVKQALRKPCFANTEPLDMNAVLRDAELGEQARYKAQQQAQVQQAQQAQVQQMHQAQMQAIPMQLPQG